MYNDSRSQLARCLIAVFVCLMLAGCVSTGHKRNFSATETTHNVKGNSTGLTLVGVVKLVTPTSSQAVANLHRKVTGDITEVGYTLENMTEKDTGWTLILVGFPRRTITADVVPKKGRAK